MASSNDEIGFDHKGIGNVLAHNRLKVPINQREYSWEEEHVTDLLQDFANAIATNKATYFLGTVVLTRSDEDIPEVSDGQQRLATTTILLAGIRDYFFGKGDLARSNSIQSDCLMTTDIDTTDTVPKLRLNVDDNEFFTRFVLEPPNSASRKAAEPTKESHKRIKAAAVIVSKYITAMLKPYSEDVKTPRLLEWVKFVREGAQVILLRVPDHLNAFMMFETLNDRGLRASQADLLKNHILQHAKDRGEEAQKMWSQTVSVLESLGQGDITVTYLHHHLITQHGPTKEREVYDKIKQLITSPSQAVDFVNDLAVGVNDYAALFSPSHPKWNDYGNATRRHLETINRDIQVVQIRPLMFATLRKFSVAETKLAFKFFVFWSVRFLVTRKGGGGLLDRNYGIQAKEVGTGKTTKAKELTAALTEIIPSDAVFQKSFEEFRPSGERFARYLLRALEQKVKEDPEPELIANDDEEVVNLEHVLPENPGENWPNITADMAGALYKRMGNLVIIQAKKNTLIANSPYEVKKPVLLASAFILTQSAGQPDEWGEDEIAVRQKKLATIALKTWPISI